MTTRERKLALILLVILLGAGSLLLFTVFYLGPVKSLNAQLDERKHQVDERNNELANEVDQGKRILALSPRLAQWKKLSLPQPVKTSAEAIKTHYTLLRGEYQKDLEKLLADAKFTVAAIRPLDPVASLQTTASKKPIYTVFPFEFEGESELPGLVTVFEKLCKEPLLQQVRKFESVPIASKSGRDKTILFTKMTVDVLLVNEAEKRDPVKNLKPTFTNKGDDKQPVMLATTGRNYQDIAKKNIFAPIVAREAPSVNPPIIGPMGDPAEDVYPFVKLTQIAKSDYYGVWTARIYNQGNKGDSALLTADPLPPDCLYCRKLKELDKRVADMKKAEETLRKGSLSSNLSQELQEQVRHGLAAESELATLEKPLTRWPVREWSKLKETLTEMQIVRIDPLQVIFQAEGKLHVLQIDASMLEAMADSLDPVQIKKLGLNANKDATLAKVELKKLEFKKDRKTFEGLFINPDNKDEKVILSNEMLPEEFDAPDTWTVKDHFGTELVSLKVVKLDKDRVIFQVGKQYYSIKPGGNMQQAMEKPLGEADLKDLKDLKLEGP